ncbi:YwmB family TATA-box binding protein [Gracilibacillus timonensis]|uniref:YwmB family TATA-box binding protein n=1 Tax=Gracilibacillus timonensis TaxID=1816696 RepID=UPI0008246A8D|nr:YwmB family TATA-box binding protein [Gracilibacillus timonensis]
MRYLFFLCSMMLAWNFIHAPGDKAAVNEEEIGDMLATFQTYDLNLANLQTTIKETRKISEMDRFIESMKGYHMNIVENEKNIRFESADKNKMTTQETLLLVPTAKDSTYQIIYTISSPLDQMKVLDTYHLKVKKVTNELFSQNAQYFSCLEAWKDDIIDIVSFIKFVKKQLDITIIDEINEPEFYTWTGYTKQWTNKLKQQDDDINVHIAVSERIGDKTNITIGTPILITEY